MNSYKVRCTVHSRPESREDGNGDLTVRQGEQAFQRSSEELSLSLKRRLGRVNEGKFALPSACRVGRRLGSQVRGQIWMG